MKELEELKPILNKLRMTGIAEILELQLQEAMEEKWSYTQLLLNLLNKEFERRNYKQTCIRFGRSGLDPQKTLDVFDFNFNKSIPEPLIKELALCHFVKKNETVFFVGQSGVGKTHLSNGIGCCACTKGINVYLYKTKELLDWIYSGKADNTYKKKMSKIIKVSLLILDDYGLLPLSEEAQLILHEIIFKRHEKAATMITSNRDFSEWINVFDNSLIGSAVMERLIHKGIKITIEGESYPMHEFKKRMKKIFKDDKI